MTPVIFWGGTGQAKVLRDAMRIGDMILVAVFDNRAIQSPFPDVPIFHTETGFAQWEQQYSGSRPVQACVAIGGAHGRDRITRTRWLSARGYPAATVVHESAFVASSAEIGEACQILAMSATSACARLGTSVIINTKASIDHDCVLGDGVHVGPGATLAGEVTVGDFAFIGAGATVLPRIHIGEDAIVGAGAVVTHDVPAGIVVIGNPARAYDKSQP